MELFEAHLVPQVQHHSTASGLLSFFFGCNVSPASCVPNYDVQMLNAVIVPHAKLFHCQVAESHIAMSMISLTQGGSGLKCVAQVMCMIVALKTAVMMNVLAKSRGYPR